MATFSFDLSHWATGIEIRGVVPGKAHAMAGCLRTPVHTVTDWRIHADGHVPYSNATQLRSALDKAGKPHEWLGKLKEGRGFQSKRNHNDLLQRVQDFLGRYLGA